MNTGIEVDELHAMSDAHDVLALHVSMDHSIAVDMLQGSGDLNGDRFDLAPILACDMLVGDDAVEVSIRTRHHDAVKVLIPAPALNLFAVVVVLFDVMSAENIDGELRTEAGHLSDGYFSSVLVQVLH